MTRLAQPSVVPQNIPVPKTTGTGFGDLCSLRRINRHLFMVAFLFPRAMSPLGGSGGDTFGYTGTRKRRVCQKFRV